MTCKHKDGRVSCPRKEDPTCDYPNHCNEPSPDAEGNCTIPCPDCDPWLTAMTDENERRRAKRDAPAGEDINRYECDICRDEKTIFGISTVHGIAEANCPQCVMGPIEEKLKADNVRLERALAAEREWWGKLRKSVMNASEPWPIASQVAYDRALSFVLAEMDRLECTATREKWLKSVEASEELQAENERRLEKIKESEK